VSMIPASSRRLPIVVSVVFVGLFVTPDDGIIA